VVVFQVAIAQLLSKVSHDVHPPCGGVNVAAEEADTPRRLPEPESALYSEDFFIALQHLMQRLQRSTVIRTP
jgi:hypothetical protein